MSADAMRMPRPRLSKRGLLGLGSFKKSQPVGRPRNSALSTYLDRIFPDCVAEAGFVLVSGTDRLRRWMRWRGLPTMCSGPALAAHCTALLFGRTNLLESAIDLCAVAPVRCVLAVRVAVARRLRERAAEGIGGDAYLLPPRVVTRETSPYRRTPTRLTPPFKLPPAL